MVDIALATITITAVFLLQGLAGIVFFFTPVATILWHGVVHSYEENELWSFSRVSVLTHKFVAGLGTQRATAAEELA